MSIHTTNTKNDIENLVSDARHLFEAAAATPLSDKALELRNKGMAALDDVCAKYDEVQARAAKKSAYAVGAVDDYVQENQWRSTLIAAAVGLLAGVVIARN